MVTVMVENDNLEKALRKFRKEVEKEAILEEYKRRQYFVKPSAVKHQKEVSLQHQIDLQNKSNKTKSDK